VQIIEYFTNAIIERRLESKQQLVENKLQRKYGISQSPIQEIAQFIGLEKSDMIEMKKEEDNGARRIYGKDFTN